MYGDYVAGMKGQCQGQEAAVIMETKIMTEKVERCRIKIHRVVGRGAPTGLK